jgi:hypothetical protein
MNLSDWGFATYLGFANSEKNMDQRSCSGAMTRPAKCRFTLRGILLFITLFGVLLGVSRWFHPVWIILLFVYVLLARCYCRSAIRRQLKIPLILVALHTLLITLAAVIESLSAWDDMSPTMLVMFAIYIFDYPIHYVFRLLGVCPNQIGLWYAAQLVATGGMLWFGVGLLLKMGLSLAARLLRIQK